jgi:hypothetical protein
LCGLTLKIKAWEDCLQRTGVNRAEQADFITSDMRTGMSRIVEIASVAPKQAA